MHRISRAKLAINHFPIFRSILRAKAFSSRPKRKFFSLSSSSPRYRGAAFTITHLVDVMRQMPTPPLPPSFFEYRFRFSAQFSFPSEDRWSANRIHRLSTISNHSLRHFLCHFPRGNVLSCNQPPYWNQCKYFTCTCTYISYLRDYIHMSDYMHM